MILPVVLPRTLYKQYVVKVLSQEPYQRSNHLYQTSSKNQTHFNRSKMLGQTLLATIALASMALAAPVANDIEERQYSYTPSYNWGSYGGSTAATSSSACTKYEVISARGTTESQTSPYGNTATVK